MFVLVLCFGHNCLKDSGQLIDRDSVLTLIMNVYCQRPQTRPRIQLFQIQEYTCRKIAGR